MNKKPLFVSVLLLVLIITIILAIFFLQSLNQNKISSGNLKSKEVQNFLTGKIIQEEQTLAVYPGSGEVLANRGDIAGFSFSVINNNKKSNIFKYKIEADYKFDFSSCKNDFSLIEANSYIQENVQKFNLNEKDYLKEPLYVFFSVPSDAPSCEIPYRLLIHYKNEDTWYPYASKTITLKIK